MIPLVQHRWHPYANVFGIIQARKEDYVLVKWFNFSGDTQCVMPSIVHPSLILENNLSFKQVDIHILDDVLDSIDNHNFIYNDGTIRYRGNFYKIEVKQDDYISEQRFECGESVEDKTDGFRGTIIKVERSKTNVTTYHIRGESVSDRIYTYNTNKLRSLKTLAEITTVDKKTRKVSIIFCSTLKSNLDGYYKFLPKNLEILSIRRVPYIDDIVTDTFGFTGKVIQCFTDMFIPKRLHVYVLESESGERRSWILDSVRAFKLLTKVKTTQMSKDLIYNKLAYLLQDKKESKAFKDAGLEGLMVKECHITEINPQDIPKDIATIFAKNKKIKLDKPRIKLFKEAFAFHNPPSEEEKTTKEDTNITAGFIANMIKAGKQADFTEKEREFYSNNADAIEDILTLDAQAEADAKKEAADKKETSTPKKEVTKSEEEDVKDRIIEKPDNKDKIGPEQSKRKDRNNNVNKQPKKGQKQPVSGDTKKADEITKKRLESSKKTAKKVEKSLERTASFKAPKPNVIWQDRPLSFIDSEDKSFIPLNVEKKRPIVGSYVLIKNERKGKSTLYQPGMVTVNEKNQLEIDIYCDSDVNKKLILGKGAGETSYWAPLDTKKFFETKEWKKYDKLIPIRDPKTEVVDEVPRSQLQSMLKRGYEKVSRGVLKAYKALQNKVIEPLQKKKEDIFSHTTTVKVAGIMKRSGSWLNTSEHSSVARTIFRFKSDHNKGILAIKVLKPKENDLVSTKNYIGYWRSIDTNGQKRVEDSFVKDTVKLFGSKSSSFEIKLRPRLEYCQVTEKVAQAIINSDKKANITTSDFQETIVSEKSADKKKKPSKPHRLTNRGKYYKKLTEGNNMIARMLLANASNKAAEEANEEVVLKDGEKPVKRFNLEKYVHNFKKYFHTERVETNKAREDEKAEKLKKQTEDATKHKKSQKKESEKFKTKDQKEIRDEVLRVKKETKRLKAELLEVKKVGQKLIDALTLELKGVRSKLGTEKAKLKTAKSKDKPNKSIIDGLEESVKLLKAQETKLNNQISKIKPDDKPDEKLIKSIEDKLKALSRPQQNAKPKTKLVDKKDKKKMVEQKKTYVAEIKEKIASDKKKRMLEERVEEKPYDDKSKEELSKAKTGKSPSRGKGKGKKVEPIGNKQAA